MGDDGSQNHEYVISMLYYIIILPYIEVPHGHHMLFHLFGGSEQQMLGLKDRNIFFEEPLAPMIGC